MYDDCFSLQFSAIYLHWYRDKGNGQSAALAVSAMCAFDGCWPVAILECTDSADANAQWDTLYKVYGVNATITYSPEWTGE